MFLLDRRRRRRRRYLTKTQLIYTQIIARRLDSTEFDSSFDLAVRQAGLNFRR